MPYIKTKSGISWHFQSQGHGETILFIHGWSFDGTVWSKQVDSFKDKHKIVALDLPGHGFSDYRRETDVVEDINFIIKELGLGRINVIGHSLGGFISLKLALQYPQAVKKLILIGTPAKFVRSKEHTFGLEENEIIKLRSFLSESYPEILSVFIRWLFTEQERHLKDYRQVWRLLTKREIWPRKEAMEEFLYLIEKEDLRKGVAKIDIPVLLVSGEKDPICPAGSTDYLSRQIKESTVELLGDCGHLPFLTQPQKFNKLVKEFLC